MDITKIVSIVGVALIAMNAMKPSRHDAKDVAQSGLTLLSAVTIDEPLVEPPRDDLPEVVATEEPVAPTPVKQTTEVCKDGVCEVPKPQSAPVPEVATQSVPMQSSQPYEVYYYPSTVTYSYVQVPMAGDCSTVAMRTPLRSTVQVFREVQPVRSVCRNVAQGFREVQPVRSVVRRVFTCR